MLLDLLYAYYRKSEVRARFGKAPVEVLDEYEIPAKFRKALLSGDRRRLVEHLLDEIDELGRPRMVILGWNPPLKVISFTPLSGPVNSDIELTVYGTGFLAGAALTFRSANGSEVMAVVKQVSETTLSGTASFKDPGEYKVTVTNPNGCADTAPQTFSAY